MAASTFGAGVGVSALLAYNAGLFLSSLSQDIGLTRTQFGLAYLLATLAIAVQSPIMGWFIDRFGVRYPTMIGAAGLSLSFVGLSVFTSSSSHYLWLMIALGLLGAGSTSVGFTRAVAGKFHAARGLALGITQAGIGISATTVPILVSFIILEYGWRSGYLILALIASLGIPTSALLPHRGAGRPGPNTSTAEFSEAIRTRNFWLLLVAFSSMSLLTIGLIVHFVPILRDNGIGQLAAAGYASLIGLSVIVSRIGVGWLADIFHAPYLAAGACIAAGLAGLALLSGNPVLLPFAACAVGIAVGAEIDLVGYLTSQYFKLDIYGRVYALQYAGVILASGASPAWIGAVADARGYDFALGAIAIGVIPVILLFLMLPRYKIGAASQARVSSEW